MDPLTQGTLGAAATLAILPHFKSFRRFGLAHLALMGVAGGMAADLDTLIRSSSDPLLSIEYHRHFTHALAFIPVGGVVAALPWLLLPHTRSYWRSVILATTLAYATHGLLDSCTSYGTLLLWPFSDYRVSWRIISVIDPLFTLPLLASVILAVRRRSTRIVQAGLAWVGLYLLVGVMQQHRALRAQEAMATIRGHSVERSIVLPSFMNNITWRSIYQSGDRYYVDKVRATWLGKSCVSEGTSVPVVADPITTDLAEARAHRLLRWFALGWVAHDPERPEVLGDLRYSFSPREATPIWGILDRHLQHQQGQVTTPYRVEWINNRSRRAVELQDLVRLIFQDSAEARCF